MKPGATVALTEVYLQYTSPVNATYTGIRVTIPAPPGATGSDLLVEIPTLTLAAGETYTSDEVSGSFVASTEPDTDTAFRPSTIHVDSASTIGGGPLDCSFSPGDPFATTTVTPGSK